MYLTQTTQTRPITHNDNSSDPWRAGKRKILLVDDDVSLSFVAKSVLEKNHMQVKVAHSGLEALELLDAFDPDAILLDVNMPQMDGFETCKNIQQKCSRTPVPVMMITGNDDVDCIRKSYRSGATDFISKPLNWPIVLQRVDFMMRSFATSARLKQKEVSLRSLIDALPDQVIRINKNLHIIDYQYGQVFSATTMDEDFFRQAHTAILGQHDKQLMDVFNSGKLTVIEGDVTFRQKRLRLEYRVVRESSDQLVAVIRDVSDIHEAQQRIHQIAYFSRDTGLPNKYYLEKKLNENVVQNSAGVFAVRVDIQELDGIKNTIPKKQYKKLLEEVSDRLARSGENANSAHHQDIPYVYKLDGSEFVVILVQEKTKIPLKRIIKEIKKQFSTPLLVDQYEVQFSPSIGASDSASCPNIKLLLKQAGQAKKTVDLSNKSADHIYSPSLLVNTKRKLTMLSHLRRAVDKGELKLMYQPQINLNQNSVTGVEALLRWNSEDLGFVTPDQFIPLAEDSGLIIPIGDFVIQESLRQAKIWKQLGFADLRMAINFSALQVHKKNIVRFIEQTLTQKKIDSKNLEIELTESAIVQDLRQTTNVLHQLRELGIRTAIDDFGTGYSSLSYLSKLPFDQIKIDRSFINELETENSHSRLLNAIISMGKSLNLEVLAEGVETEYQKSYLLNNHCDSMQGFLISKPRDPEEIVSLLKGWSSYHANTYQIETLQKENHEFLQC